MSQENAVEDADALTLRSRIAYKTPTKNGFSALIEVGNSTALIDDYSFPPVGLNPGQFSIVADPDSHTEIDQAFVRYQYDKSPSVKLGRQVLTLDNHRFVGHVGWHQDRQTFDAFSVDFAPTAKTAIKYAYLDKRHRIFADERDIDAKDHLFNASYKFASGKLTTYAYLLVDDGTDNSLDTFGISYSGKGAGLFYRAE